MKNKVLVILIKKTTYINYKYFSSYTKTMALDTQTKRTLTQAMIEFELLTKVSIEECIGKIPKDSYFYQECNKVLTVISSNYQWVASFNGPALCGSGLDSHSGYAVIIKFTGCHMKSLVLRNHYDSDNNIELKLSFNDGTVYRSLDDWDCLKFDGGIKMHGEKKSYDEIIEMLMGPSE